jgi:hypothetical protein
MAEVPLPGGNTTGAVLIDDVIHKPASPWTLTVHALLRYLEEAGFAGAPRALGFDSSGREMLSYLPGETIGNQLPWPAWVSADSMLVQVGQWLRRLHDLTAGFRPPADERWFIGGEMRPGLIIGHQDAAPYNAVVDGERLVGFYDGFEGDREVFRSVIPERARRQAGVIRNSAAAGDPASVALLPIAGLLEASAVGVEALPHDFWSH